jgi:hypothetical protein
MNAARPSRLARVVAQFQSPADVLLAARVMVWACVLPILKRVMPIRSLVRLAWRPPGLERDPTRDARVVTFARWACRVIRPGSGGNCLERGLIAYRFLLEGRAEPTLVIGMRRHDANGVIGHAWVLLHGTPAGESPVLVKEYVPMFAFAPDGSLIRSLERLGDEPELSATRQSLP